MRPNYGHVLECGSTPALNARTSGSNDSFMRRDQSSTKKSTREIFAGALGIYLENNSAATASSL